MELLPPPTDQTWNTLDEPITSVDEWAKKQGYAVRKQRTKHDPAKKRGIIKAFLVCSKWGETMKRGKHRNTSSQRCDSSFKAYAVHKQINDASELHIVNPEHSGHEPANPKGLPIHRRAAMTPAIMDDIRHHTREQHATPT